MNSKNVRVTLIHLSTVIGLLFLIGCNDEESSGLLSQHFQAHQSEIVDIEIATDSKLVLRSNQSLKFEAYGLLSDGSRLQTEADNEGNTSDQTISDLVNWSVDNDELARISTSGLLTGLENSGSVTVTASFSGQEVAVNVLVTDAELTQVIIDTEITDIEVCRNLQLTAIGLLADGNEVSFESNGLIWRAENTDPDNRVGEFKNERIGTLSTFLSGSVAITTRDSSGSIISSPLIVTVTSGLDSITLSNTTENTMEVGESIEITATGIYPSGSFDITDSTLFSSGDDRATFTDNILTAKGDAETGEVAITGSCDSRFGELTIEVVDPGL